MLSNISNIPQQIETIINHADGSFIKQESNALKRLREDRNLIIRKADRGNTFVLMEKDNYCNILVLKHHLNASAYEKVDTDIGIRVFNNLKSLLKT